MLSLTKNAGMIIGIRNNGELASRFKNSEHQSVWRDQSLVKKSHILSASQFIEFKPILMVRAFFSFEFNANEYTS
jgi:hypothetical protein